MNYQWAVLLDATISPSTLTDHPLLWLSAKQAFRKVTHTQLVVKLLPVSVRSSQQSSARRKKERRTRLRLLKNLPTSSRSSPLRFPRTCKIRDSNKYLLQMDLTLIGLTRTIIIKSRLLLNSKCTVTESSHLSRPKREISPRLLKELSTD